MRKFALFAVFFFAFTFAVVHANTSPSSGGSGGAGVGFDSEFKRLLGKEYKPKSTRTNGAAVDVDVHKGNKHKNFRLSVKAGTIAKNLGRGLNAAALAAAAYDLLGAGVDYVLDPANNRVTIKGGGDSYCTNGAYTGSFDHVHTNMCKDFNATISGSNLIRQSGGFSHYRAYCVNKLGQASGFGTIQCGFLSDRHISLDELANIVIEKANQGDPDAQDAVRTAVLDDLTSGAYDDLIRQVANEDEGWELTDPTSDTDSETDTDTGTSDNPSNSTDPKPDGSLPDDGSESESDSDTKDENKPELPAFCDWATVVCDWLDWTQEKPPDATPPKPIPKATLSDLGIDDNRFNDRVNFVGQCPTGSLSFNAMGRLYERNIPYTHFCDLLEKLRPWLLAFSYLSVAFFVVSNL